uniref:Uncharacterized protein n=1 Tax=Ditylenchus dipsaci TaxID=166011 RepID=A0A915DTK0_9BILA
MDMAISRSMTTTMEVEEVIGALRHLVVEATTPMAMHTQSPMKATILPLVVVEHNRGMAHARYGSLSDSLRRGELKYIPNGEVREANGQNGYSKHTKVHKVTQPEMCLQPVVEFPPTLPREGRYGSHLDAPVPPPHRGGGDSYRPLTKSRSYADWDQGRGPFGNSVSRYDEDMARLENEFRDSHLIRVPNGPMNEKEYRHQEIPGGYESYSRDTKANGGRKLNRDGLPTDFKETSQEYNFKREQQR